ncbi:MULTISPECIES: hypothetical protein [unclassified Nonomuraea]|uniref:hypothetical protein n=1 Tax=unclassified Nonomuraea TaxID=2593643 RepID=UPI003426BEC8
MRLSTILRHAAIVGTAGLTLSIVGAGGASASASADKTLSGSCSSDPKGYSGSARYYYNSAGSDVFTKFTYTIGGRAGSKTDVAIDVYSDKNNAVDKWHGGWGTDSAKVGTKSATVHIISPAKDKVYVKFWVRWDLPGLDPTCSFQTKRI